MYVVLKQFDPIQVFEPDVPLPLAYEFVPTKVLFSIVADVVEYADVPI